MQVENNYEELPTAIWKFDFRSLHIIDILLAVVIFSLSISPKVLFPDLEISVLNATTLQNLLIGIVIVIYGLWRGFRLFNNPLVWVYAVIFLNTFILASRHPELSFNQMLQSFASFMLGILLLHVNLTSAVRRLLWSMIPWMAIGSLLIGVGLQLIGVHNIFRQLTYANGDIVYRLQASSIPSVLAHLALLGMMISLLFARSNRIFLALSLVNYTVIFLAASRSDIIMGFFLFMVYLLPDIRLAWQTRHLSKLKHIGFVLGIVIILVVVNSPSVITRLTQTRSTERTAVDSYSSGRTLIWKDYWSEAESNLIFGRGMGAGVITVPERDVKLNVPHNEYLRLIVDGGFVGLGLVVCAYGYIFWKIIKHTTQFPRRFLLASVIIFAGLSVLNNTLTTQSFSVLFWVWWAVIAYDSLSSEEKLPAFKFGILKIYTGFPPEITQ